MSKAAQDKRPGCRLALGLGCAIALIAALMATLGAGVLALVLVCIRQTDPLPEALTWARAQTPLRERLGEPIETGWLIQGSVSIQNQTGSASLRIPLEGPLGEGVLKLDARFDRGAWRYRTLEFQTEDENLSIDLAPCPASQRPCALPVILER